MSEERAPSRALIFSAAAERDLIDIYAYTHARWGERQADAYLDDMRQAIERIADGQAIVRRLEFREDDMMTARQGRHLIVHRAEGQAIRIVRILHQRMDIDTRLDER